MHNTVCLICSEKNRTIEKNQLLAIERLLRSVKTDGKTKEAARGCHFMWGIHARCPYGLPCQERESYKSECDMIASRIELKLVAVAISDDARLYHETLRYLQGHFPAIYRIVERIHHQGSFLSKTE